ncbi:sigma-54-dependent Fis family transcriptional regulator [Pollutimonas nitritireducens]|uniref:Sigma-54-dependent Fis family transcriptional regulator n=1 Tax=Pollutimonas nitritireducens TaxID=2045209 RepID=A0A2N4ULM0_9BURK|nr:sigma 54-interacting transcriptional regulator [Pollutimonas nitritireducens]PLC55916.1 sigma-54-dependent Fis family transcriptional regulator [Pollutimonas nitritireducens]
MAGVLILNDQKSVAYASGLAANPAIQRQLLQELETGRGQGSGIVALNEGGKYIAVYRSLGDEFVFLIEAVDSESTLFGLVASVDFAVAVLTYLVESPYLSLVLVDDQARIRFMPPVHEKFFGLERGEAIGKHVTEVIENTKLHKVVQSGKAEIGKLQEMGGITRVVSRVPIKQNGKIVGAIGQVMFKGPTTVHELSQEVSKLRSQVAFYKSELSGIQQNAYDLEQMIGESDAIRQLKADIMKVAPMHVPVLIVGESGTGKELAAQALHGLSARSKSRMVFVNAAALPSSLVESELFGYEAGAFTGADKSGRKGKFEQADKTSLFFDEIGDMAPEIQVKLLRVLQDGMFERVGGNRVYHSDFRLICASNRSFQEMINEGTFRLDLYYRISGVTIRMPSLRERLDDIPALVPRFLLAFANRHRMPVKRVDKRVYPFLQEQPWPGNVRQLLHEVEKAAIFSDGPELRVEDFRMTGGLLEDAAPSEATSGISAPTTRVGSRHRRIQDAVNEVERTMISEAMVRHRSNKKKVAEDLGISRAYLYKRLAEIAVA